ncbi:MAG TPA: YkvA family protein, partial [Puia sp.]|nr:YkvA family protein [Puia sp.]
MAIASFSTYRRASRWRQQILMLYYGLKDPRSPFYSKIPAIAGLAYLLSPIDLIPDFIPFAGYLDDLFIVPLLFQLSLRLLPTDVIEASRTKAIRQQRKITWILIILVVIFIL